jgi:hypothetical protein
MLMLRRAGGEGEGEGAGGRIEWRSALGVRECCCVCSVAVCLLFCERACGLVVVCAHADAQGWNRLSECRTDFFTALHPAVNETN